MKAAWKERPYTIFAVSAAFTVIALSFLIRIFERPYYAQNFAIDKFLYFDSLGSSVWYIIITMTSVGYGDVVAVTPVGRWITIFAALFGAFYLSLMVALVMDSLILQEKQDLGMHKVKDQARCARSIAAALRYNAAR